MHYANGSLRFVAWYPSAGQAARDAAKSISLVPTRTDAIDFPAPRHDTLRSLVAPAPAGTLAPNRNLIPHDDGDLPPPPLFSHIATNSPSHPHHISTLQQNSLQHIKFYAFVIQKGVG